MALYKNYYFLFLIGGIGYPLLELLWRGHTHPSMGIVGGFGLIVIYTINKILNKKNPAFRALCCAGAITVIEFVSGVFLNIFLQLDIWDYSDRPFNILGQVCLLYSALWFLLSFVIIHFIEKLEKRYPIKSSIG